MRCIGKRKRIYYLITHFFRSYNVKGTLPKYLPPVAVESKINDHLHPELEEKLKIHKPKNFIQQNLTQA